LSHGRFRTPGGKSELAQTHPENEKKKLSPIHFSFRGVRKMLGSEGKGLTDQ